MTNLAQEDGILLFQQKRYAASAEAFRQFLAQRPAPGLEADTRRRLADALASAGQAEEAAAESELAASIAEATSGDPMALMTKGDFLKREHRHDEACAAYEQALRLLPPKPSEQPELSRAYLMAKLAIAHYEASRPAKAVIWAGAALVNNPNDTIRLLMHQQCGIGYSGLGDLKKAEEHYFEALKLAVAGGKPQEAAQSLTTLGTVQRKRGDFEKAISTAQRSIAIFPSPGRGAPLLEVECLRDMGRFDEARRIVDTMKQGPRYDRPDLEKRSQVIFSLTLVWIEANDDQPAAALVSLQEAWGNLGVTRDSFPFPLSPAAGEDKLVLYCDATAVRVYAQLGQVENARQMQERVKARLGVFAQDRAGLMTIYAQFAPAAFAISDFDQSRYWWDKYLECQPDPVGSVKAYFGLGNALLNLSETEAARDAFQKAVAPGIDSLDARRAQARLDEMSG